MKGGQNVILTKMIFKNPEVFCSNVLYVLKIRSNWESNLGLPRESWLMQCWRKWMVWSLQKILTKKDIEKLFSIFPCWVRIFLFSKFSNLWCRMVFFCLIIPGFRARSRFWFGSVSWFRPILRSGPRFGTVSRLGPVLGPRPGPSFVGSTFFVLSVSWFWTTSGPRTGLGPVLRPGPATGPRAATWSGPEM